MYFVRGVSSPFAQQYLKLLGPPNSGRSVAEWAPTEFEKGDGRLRPSSNIASPAQRGPRRDAQPLHATPWRGAVVHPSGGPSAPGRRCWRLGRKRPSPFSNSGPTPLRSDPNLEGLKFKVLLRKRGRTPGAAHAKS